MTVRELINFLLDKNMDATVSLVTYEGLDMIEHEVADVWGQDKCYICIGERIDNRNV